MSGQNIQLVKVGDAADPFLIVANLWELFMEKGTQTIFVSVGASTTSQVELDIMEMLGCKALLLDPESKNIALWQQVKECLTTRSKVDVDPFVAPALKKWVLARNLFTVQGLPCVVEGFGSYVRIAKSIEQFIQDAKLNVEGPRIDIMKIDKPGAERIILQEVLDSGFRPALLMVRWEHEPDSDLRITEAAGHLQMCGYQLIGKEENKYLYYYNDKNLYEICSWQDTTVENPLLHTIFKSCAKQVRGPLATAAPASEKEAPSA